MNRLVPTGGAITRQITPNDSMKPTELPLATGTAQAQVGGVQHPVVTQDQAKEGDAWNSGNPAQASGQASSSYPNKK